MADEKKPQFKTKTFDVQDGTDGTDDEGDEIYEWSEQRDKGKKKNLVDKHYDRNNPHVERPEVLSTKTVSAGVHVVKLKDSNGSPYLALLIEDGDTSSLLGVR